MSFISIRKIFCRKMPGRPATLVAGLALFLTVGRIIAQTPTQILAVKFTEYGQTSTTASAVSSADFAFSVDFASTPESSTTVQLRSPTGTTVSLDRDAAGEYSLMRNFASVAELDANFPDGVYTLTIGGISATTLNIALLTGNTVPPTLIANFDAVQSSPTASPTIIWQPIASSGSGTGVLSLEIDRDDGGSVFETPDTFSATNTQVTASNLPINTPLTGHLSFARVSVSVVNNGATRLGTGRGFDLAFSLQAKPPPPAPPTISYQPTSTIAAPGALVQLNVNVPSGAVGVKFQWKKDGVPIPGATSAQLQFSSVQVSDAGTYTVDVSNASGTVTSDPAVVGVIGVYKFTPYAGVVGKPGSADGPSGVGRLAYAHAMAMDVNGAMFVVDAACIRKVAPDGTITTFAGLAGATGTADGAGSNARFNSPWAIGIDLAGNLYVSDIVNQNIRKISSAGVVTTLAGVTGQRGYRDGTGASALFNSPTGIAVDAGGNVFVCDNSVIRRITPAGVVTTFAGQAGVSGFVDGVGSAARFGNPTGLAIDRNGTLYVGETFNYAIRKITPDGRVQTFVASSPGNLTFSSIAVDDAGNVYASGGDFVRYMPDGFSHTRISFPIYSNANDLHSSYFLPPAVMVKGDGTAFVSDGYNGVILKGTLTPGSSTSGINIVAAPQTITAMSGHPLALRVSATGPNIVYQWSKDGSVLPNQTGSTLFLPSANASSAGVYTVVVANSLGSATTSAVVTLGSDASASRLSNLAIRARAGTGAQMLTVGAVVGGGAGGVAATDVLIRAVGPGLKPFNVPDALSDPAFTLFRDSQVFSTNDNWNSTSGLAAIFTAVGAFALTDGSLDAALLQSLTTGSYSAQVMGNSNASGIVLAEIYEANRNGATASTPRLINLSTRTQVGTDADILIAGFTVSGTSGITLLIRAAGPSLARFSVPGVLNDPQLKIYAGNQLVAANDNWFGDSTVADASTRVGAFAFDSQQDAAVLVTLSPGSYTAQVSGVNNTTGVALVEIYEVP